MAILARIQRSSSTGYCGAFDYTDDWQLTGQVQGFILQKITRTLTVYVYSKRSPLQELLPPPDLLSLEEAKSKFDPQGISLNLDTMTYWELFPVPAAGDIDGDRFGTNWFAPTHKGQPQATTTGEYSIVGIAAFYETTKLPTELGFPGPNLAVANGLASTGIDPSAHFVKLPASNRVSRSVTATWDSRTKDHITNSYGVTNIVVA